MNDPQLDNLVRIGQLKVEPPSGPAQRGPAPVNEAGTARSVVQSCGDAALELSIPRCRPIARLCPADSEPPSPEDRTLGRRAGRAQLRASPRGYRGTAASARGSARPGWRNGRDDRRPRSGAQMSRSLDKCKKEGPAPGHGHSSLRRQRVDRCPVRRAGPAGRTADRSPDGGEDLVDGDPEKDRLTVAARDATATGRSVVRGAA